jgi:hypothetical protein
MDVHVYTAVEFPEEWRRLWFKHSTVRDMKGRRNDVDFGGKRELEEFVRKQQIPLDSFRPMPMPELPRLLDAPYVVLIPTVFGHRHNENFGPRQVLSLEWRFWKELAEVAHSFGREVIGFGGECSCTREQLEELADVSFFLENKEVRPRNRQLPEQLQWMMHAEMCVAFGGPIHLSMCFDVPGLGYDGQIYNNYRRFSGALATQRTTPLIYGPLATMFGERVRKNPEQFPLDFPMDPRLPALAAARVPRAADFGALKNQAIRYHWGCWFVEQFTEFLAKGKV